MNLLKQNKPENITPAEIPERTRELVDKLELTRSLTRDEWTELIRERDVYKRQEISIIRSSLL